MADLLRSILHNYSGNDLYEVLLGVFGEELPDLLAELWEEMDYEWGHHNGLAQLQGWGHIRECTLPAARTIRKIGYRRYQGVLPNTHTGKWQCSPHCGDNIGPGTYWFGLEGSNCWVYKSCTGCTIALVQADGQCFAWHRQIPGEFTSYSDDPGEYPWAPYDLSGEGLDGYKRPPCKPYLWASDVNPQDVEKAFCETPPPNPVAWLDESLLSTLQAQRTIDALSDIHRTGISPNTLLPSSYSNNKELIGDIPRSLWVGRYIGSTDHPSWAHLSESSRTLVVVCPDGSYGYWVRKSPVSAWEAFEILKPTPWPEVNFSQRRG